MGVTPDGTIAVFQGIPGTIAGFDLSTVNYLSNTKLDDLTPVAQDKVKEGIPAASQQEARAQLDNLAALYVLPPCPVPTLSPTPDAGWDADELTGPERSATPSDSPTPGATYPTGTADLSAGGPLMTVARSTDRSTRTVRSRPRPEPHNHVRTTP